MYSKKPRLSVPGPGERLLLRSLTLLSIFFVFLTIWSLVIVSDINNKIEDGRVALDNTQIEFVVSPTVNQEHYYRIKQLQQSSDADEYFCQFEEGNALCTPSNEKTRDAAKMKIVFTSAGPLYERTSQSKEPFRRMMIRTYPFGSYKGFY